MQDNDNKTPAEIEPGIYPEDLTDDIRFVQMDDKTEEALRLLEIAWDDLQGDGRIPDDVYEAGLDLLEQLKSK
jgi:hypothetical protein